MTADVDDRAARRGPVDPSICSWGAFTTVGCENGRPLLWQAHRRRLGASLKALGAPVDTPLPTRGELEMRLQRQGLLGPARLRVVVQRQALATAWSIDINAQQLDIAPGAGPDRRPAELITETWPGAPPLIGHKTLARLAWDLARQQAQEAGADDALIVGENGSELETSIGNIFARFGDRLLTPEAPTCCLPGVMRGWLLTAAGSVGLAAGSSELTLDQLVDADELWITSSLAGVLRVGRLSHRRWTRWPAFQGVARIGVPAPGWPGAARSLAPGRPDQGAIS